MDPGLQTWLVVFVAATAVAVILQLGILAALFFGVRRLQSKIERILDHEVEPLLANLRDLVGDGRKAVSRLNGAADEAAEFARRQSARLDQLLAEAADRARLQLIRADELVADAFNRIEKTTEYIQRRVTAPVREMQAVLAGVRTALDFLFGRRHSPAGPVERTTQDEELFI